MFIHSWCRMCKLCSTLISLCPRVSGRFELQDVCLYKDTLYRPRGEAIMRDGFLIVTKKTNLSAEVESFLSGYVQMFEMFEMVKCLNRSNILIFGDREIFNLFFRWYFWVAHFRAEDSFSKLLDISSRIFKNANNSFLHTVILFQ